MAKKKNTTIKIEDLLTHTESLFRHVHMVSQDLGLVPKKEHTAAAIAYTDIRPRVDQFLRELKGTVTSWVYSKATSKKLLEDKLNETNDMGNAAEFLTRLAHSKFRKGHPQGQFGELLLFNFLQHLFQAVPILRKMPVTTSPGHERFGADALHYKNEGSSHKIILGESKCYESKYKFKTAFEKSLVSIIDSFNNLDNELHQFVCDEFIEEPLLTIAKNYKDNKLANVQYELTSIIIYNETSELGHLKNETQIHNEIVRIIKEKCGGIEDKTYKIASANVLDRINYIIFPVWKLDELLNKFDSSLGI
ncbi:DUF1837 domain-containing protein [Leptospira semungkisensis]|uniref:DUF1837 domain-containing protein n=1 Tax=Leptospira semungkisensis TaxID=2484985 RepID=A0A4R9FY80_9LEPT|nr:DUF1837 domain-containing protein [Leptospira semungkisensis]TGK03783.1 DUF1837 domain-containing protein [Leptospira semungkisensis]